MRLINYGLTLLNTSIVLPTIVRFSKFTDFFKFNFNSILNQVNFVVSANIINSGVAPSGNQQLLLLNKPKLPDINTLKYKSLSKCNNKKSILHTETQKLPSLRFLRSYQKGPKTPELIYVPHIFRWLKNKLQFKYLQRTWDPEFSEGAFIYGTIHAVCKITDIIHRDKPKELEGLLTEFGKIKLKNEMSVRFSKTQKAIIKILPEDIKILVPIAVRMKKSGVNKECSVSLRSLALKWFKDRYGLKLVLVALQTEFIRDYSKGADSEWTINSFDVLECAMLTNKSQVKK